MERLRVELPRKDLDLILVHHMDRAHERLSDIQVVEIEYALVGAGCITAMTRPLSL